MNRKDLLLTREAKALTALCRRHRWVWKFREDGDSGGYSFVVHAAGDPRHTYWRGTVYGPPEDAIRQVRRDLGEIEPMPSAAPAAPVARPREAARRPGGKFAAAGAYVLKDRDGEAGEFKTLAAAKAAASADNRTGCPLKWKKEGDNYYSDGDYDILLRGR